MTNQEIQNISIQGESIENCIETHISWVIITEKHAYKIKKPVHFSFVDFSTLEKRKYFCEQEVILNNRLTKEMYLGIVPIGLMNSKFIIGEVKLPIQDYAVKMTRQNLNDQMHLKLEENSVNENHINQIAKVISAFHKKLTPLNIPFNEEELKSTFNDIDSIRKFVDERFGEPYSRIISNAIALSNDFTEKYKSAFAQRTKRGMIRDCHGDLHSGNIFLNDHPIIFDCIEFNPAFRHIDLLYEIAFFCMDLDSFGREDYKNLFLGEYQKLFPEVTEEDTDRLLFIYYKLLRANIKTKVLALKLKQQGGSEQEFQDVDEEKRYIRLMMKYCIQLEKEMSS